MYFDNEEISHWHVVNAHDARPVVASMGLHRCARLAQGQPRGTNHMVTDYVGAWADVALPWCTCHKAGAHCYMKPIICLCTSYAADRFEPWCI